MADTLAAPTAATATITVLEHGIDDPFVPATDVIDVLRRTRQRVEGSWYQGSLVDQRTVEHGPNGCDVCLMGAVAWACTGYPSVQFGGRLEQPAVFHAAMQVLDEWAVIQRGRRSGLSTHESVLFNDDLDVVEDDVLQLIDHAIAWCECLVRVAA